jgi:maltose alpha-D-glucosyltransferase/alpha-amylase
MGENLEIPGRRAVRSPMQWAPGPGGGFSSASPEDLRRPMPSGAYSPDKINVIRQLDDSDSTLSWMKRLIGRRRWLPEIGLGRYRIVDVGATEAFGIQYEWADRKLLTVANFSQRAVEVDISEAVGKGSFSDVWADVSYQPGTTFELSGNGYRWIRIGSEQWFL